MSSNSCETAFDGDKQNLLFMIEAKSWWFQYRAGLISGLMKKYYDKTVLTTDVGGGNGYTTSVLSKKGYNVSLLEPSIEACKNAEKRGIKTHAGMLTENYPDDGEYRQVLLLDVLEHIKDDNAFLTLLLNKMASKGRLLITVPAHMALWSSEDDYAGHFRRYKEAELLTKLKKAGFDILYSSYYMSFLTLPIFIVRVCLERIGLVKRQDKRTEEERLQIMKKQFQTGERSLVNRILMMFEKREYRRIMKGIHQRWGASIIIVAGKP